MFVSENSQIPTTNILHQTVPLNWRLLFVANMQNCPFSFRFALTRYKKVVVGHPAAIRLGFNLNLLHMPIVADANVEYIYVRPKAFSHETLVIDHSYFEAPTLVRQWKLFFWVYKPPTPALKESQGSVVWYMQRIAGHHNREPGLGIRHDGHGYSSRVPWFSDVELNHK